jgi:hypothetical protein
MSIKFFRNQRALFMFDPDTYKTFEYHAGRWVESNRPDCLDEIRFRTVEISMSEIQANSVLGRKGEQYWQVY